MLEKLMPVHGTLAGSAVKKKIWHQDHAVHLILFWNAYILCVLQGGRALNNLMCESVLTPHIIFSVERFCDPCTGTRN